MASSLTAFSGGTVRSWRQIANLLIIFRMWRNEVNMRKRERTRQQAEELRKMQKLFLLKAMSSPGKLVAEQPDLCGDGQQAKASARLHTNTSKLSRIL